MFACQVPGLLVVSLVAGLATVLFGYLLLRSQGEIAMRDARIGTWIFFVGLSTTLISTVIISTFSTFG